MYFISIWRCFTLFTHSTNTLLPFTYACCGKIVKYSLWICSVRSVPSVTPFSQRNRSLSNFILTVTLLSQWHRSISDLVLSVTPFPQWHRSLSDIVLSVISFSQWPRSISDINLSATSFSQWHRSLSDIVLSVISFSHFFHFHLFIYFHAVTYLSGGNLKIELLNISSKANILSKPHHIINHSIRNLMMNKLK